MATTSLQACADCPAPPSASDSGVHSGVRRGDQGPPPRPAPAQSTSAVKQDDVLDPSTFEPPQLNQGEDGEELPRVVIEFCDRCRWLHRATWTQTELFLTFPPPALHSITLVPRNAPETGGRFRVWLLRYRSLEQEYDDTVGKGKERWNGWELVWDRKIERGFPEMKDLQRIRNIIAPSQDLGHSDKPVKVRA
ncbi:Rdx family-domain-containing protein [Rhodotorula diobovata]|uniref:Rdx family-domain-containing protein n=1 Tax=Rhodotorula diobovata TaxID=5288 RepID=A0A5C5G3M3_9BASI|nr:Rdx family-domain-containing protein [Rhodotorula diobovata]